MSINEFVISQGLVFIDLETTGLAPERDRIIEIGILKVRDGKVIGKFHSLINPQVPIPEDSAKISGIYDADVANAPTFEEIAHQVIKFFDTGIFVAHNADFDYEFLTSELRRIGLSFAKPTLDTMQLSKFFYPAQGSHRLDAVAKVHGIKIRARHRALDDARALHKLHEKLCEKFGQNRVRTVCSRLIQHRSAKSVATGHKQVSLL